MSAIAVVSFDVAGTLLKPEPSVGRTYAEILARRRISIQPTALETLFRESYLAALRDRPTEIDAEADKAFWRNVVHGTIGRYCPPITFETVFREIYDEFAQPERWAQVSGALDAVKAAKAGGYTTCVLSNADERTRNVLEGHGFTDHLDHVFLSVELGYEKPDPRVFRKVQNSLGAPGEAILHIGDSTRNDGDGPLLAGWNALIFDPNGSKTGYDQVVSLTDFSRILACRDSC